MSNEEIKQRIQYLIEHGGMYDDPLADLRRMARLGVGLGTLAVVICIVEMAVHLS